VGHRCGDADLRQPQLAAETELTLFLDAFADELPVARLEDVQGDALRRQEHHPQRKETELGHLFAAG